MIYSTRQTWSIFKDTSLIFNGKIRTPDKLKSFYEFLSILNKKLHKLSRKLKKLGLNNAIFEQIKLFKSTKEITLTDNWLIGFVVAEGCFHASFPLNKNYFCILFDLAQKGEDNKKNSIR